ncbi:response regulator transcription factor [bacterium]|nr:response regulator transcription factor [bacterium]
MNNKTISIIIGEDNKLIRTGIKSVLSDIKDFSVVSEASSGVETIEKVLKYKPDILLLDHELHDITGIDVITRIKDENIATKTIILTGHYLPDEIKTYIELGIYAYVLKDISSEMLENIIRTVYRGAMWFDSKIANDIRGYNVSSDSLKQNNKSFKNNHANLTQREFEVLKLIVEGKSNNQIAKELCISEHTAKAHVCNIIQKLVVDDRTQAAVKALKEGIIQ